MAFRNLTKIQDQGAIIEEVKKTLGDDIISQIEKKEIDGGICYMLSMEWLRRIMEDDPIADFNNLCLNDEKEREKKLAYFKQIANNFFGYARNLSYVPKMEDEEEETEAETPGLIYAETERGRLSNMANINSLFVDMCSGGKLQAYTVCGSRKRISQAFTSGKSKFYLLGYTAGWVDQDGNVQSEGHKMAFAVNTSGKLWFYDPNTGVHEADTFQDILGVIDTRYLQKLPNGYKCKFDICTVTPKEGNA